eukprot:CAMPEP_0176137320 /NCGR_PEP_ID=MMETSP0120_2-20121206/69712_1 /TAXON_ID=160619 /ORGANISM="Kryptoperidinium foliaceum, Strain CCMP 1326" /LENGTH=53 /DNA_ID=CAMNT_0017473157 /DNA_START=96 /DNA_END=254 /DNA_ORIENTATION=-
MAGRSTVITVKDDRDHGLQILRNQIETENLDGRALVRWTLPIYRRKQARKAVQ